MRRRLALLASTILVGMAAPSACDRQAPPSVVAPRLDDRASSPGVVVPVANANAGQAAAPVRVITAETDSERLTGGAVALDVVPGSAAPSAPAPTRFVRDGGAGFGISPPPRPRVQNMFAPKVVAEGPLVVTDAVTDAQGLLLFSAPSSGGCGTGGDWSDRPEGAQLVAGGPSLVHPGMHGTRFFIKAGSVLCVTGVTWANDAAASQLSWTGFVPY